MLHHNGCPMPWQPTPHCVSLLMYHLTMFDQPLRTALGSPWQQELLKNCKNWLRWWINIFHINKHSPDIPCLISLYSFSTPDLKLKTNEFVYDGMLCFPLNPYHWHVVLFTGLPTPPRFGFCMHNFWISPMGMGVRMPKYLTIYYRSTGSLQENMRICQGNLGEFSGKNCPTSIAINQLAVKITRRSLSFGCICINSSTCFLSK